MKDFEIISAQKCSYTGEKFSLNYTFCKSNIFIMFVSSGRCKAVLNNTCHTLSAGDFLINIGSGSLGYKFSRLSDATVYCVTASVQNDVNAEENFSLSSGVYRCYDIRNAKIAFSKVIREFYLKSPHSDIRLSALFTELLCVLSESREETTKVISEIIRLADDIHKDFTKDICVSSYSDNVRLSKDRFSVIFRERFGYAPYKYQLMLKMNEATYLLTHTDLPIAKISEMLGFSNQLYFSSAYKKQMGISPSQARKGAVAK